MKKKKEKVRTNIGKREKAVREWPQVLEYLAYINYKFDLTEQACWSSVL